MRNVRELVGILKIRERYRHWLLDQTADLKLIRFCVDIWYTTVIAHADSSISMIANKEMSIRKPYKCCKLSVIFPFIKSSRRVSPLYGLIDGR